MTKVLYPGSFAPITKGHMDIVENASKLFDEVIIAVLKNRSKKSSFFTIEERVELIEEIYKDIENIKVVTSSEPAVDVALSNDCKAIVRGLRSLSDYDYEVQLSEINKDISNGQISTVCLFADKEYQFISSSVVKEVLCLDKDISKYVHPLVKQKMLVKKEVIKSE